MSLLTQASLVLTPNAYKSSKLYSIIPSNGNGDMTFTRALSTATRINSSGVIETVNANVPRLNYTNGVASILLEPQRTNLLTYSEDFSNSVWIKDNSTITTNLINSPNNTLTADKLIENTTTSSHRTFFPYTGTIGSNSLSVYAKAGERVWIRLSIFDSGTTKICNFNISNGTIGTNTGLISYSISLVNGWYKCSITGNIANTSCQAQINIASDDNVTSYTGDGTSGVYIWGAQLETGAYSTSYIPTTSSTVTRNQDIISRDNIYTKLITSAGGTWFIELNNNFSLTRDAASNGIYLADNISVNNGFRIRVTVPGRFVIEKVISATNTQLYATLTDTVKIAFKWNGTSMDIYVNGTKVVSSTAFTFTAMELLSFNATDVPKYIKSMMLFPTPLTDAECISLTTL